MIKKNTLLSLMLLLTTLAFTQKAKTVKHHWLKDTKKHFSDETKYEYLPIENYLASNRKQVRTPLSTLRNTTTIQSFDSIINYNWDVSSNQWINSYKTEYTYDVNGNLTVEINYDWDSNTSQWIDPFKSESTFDANQNLITEILYDWNSTTNQWENSYKTVYTYDTNQNLLTRLSYQWDSNINQWIISYKSEYTYDANGNQTTKINYNWNTSTSQWIINSKNEYTYDTNGNQITNIDYSWNSTTSQWENSNKREYTYDINDNKTLEIGYYWNFGTNQWINSFKSEFIYDANGNLTTEIDNDWDSSTNQWINSYKYDLTIDVTTNISDLFVPPIYYDFFANKLLSYLSYEWNETTNSWELTSNGVDYYSDITANVNQTTNDKLVTVYPNPANNNLHIKLNNNSNAAIFNLFDIQGKKLITQKVIKNEPINISHLNAGMYLYSITTNGKESRGKILKK